MGLVRNITDRIVVRLHRRNEYESLFLRAYFKRHHDIDVGLYTIGPFDRWRVPPGTRIGRYCSIARTARLLDADHPVEALSTHPYFYLRDLGVVPEDRAKVRPPVIEDDVWIAHNAVVTAGCKHIGRGAIIGAGAVVMADVPPYAIMVGAPARLVRFRFSPSDIEAIEASQWWTLDKADLAEALAAAPDFATRPGRDTAAAFVASSGTGSVADPTRSETTATTTEGSSETKARIFAVLEREIPGFTTDDVSTRFSDLNIDSFGLISLRIAVEQALGRQISDQLWGQVQCPADLLGISTDGGQARVVAPPPASAQETKSPPVTKAASFSAAIERRDIPVNMPQMALRGLSESWLFKELGDLHWSVLSRGLKTASADIADTEGNRLYATFTRISIQSPIPLTSIRENETLGLELSARRYGAGMFFGDAIVSGAAGSMTATLMTSFSKFGEAGANTSLLKGQPLIPPDCAIPSLDAAPDFAADYRTRRSAQLPEPLFQTDYEILPPHDINGVGLLYFAAYPTIIDLCAMRYGGRSLLFDYSTTSRDVCYFSNALPDEILVFKLHEWHEREGSMEFSASLSRKSDGVLMAHVMTKKAFIGIPKSIRREAMATA